jgi:hypothetical protein
MNLCWEKKSIERQRKEWEGKEINKSKDAVCRGRDGKRASKWSKGLLQRGQVTVQSTEEYGQSA